MANWGPKKMCPRSDKVGKLTGNEKHLVTACSSESRLRRVTGGGQLEKQRRSLWRLDSHGGAALLGCSHMSYEIGLSCWLGLGWDVHGGVGSAFFLEMSMFGPWSAHRHSMPRAVTWVPASLSTARLWPLCLDYFFFLPKRANTYKGVSFLLWGRCACNALFILRAKCFCRDNWTKLRMAHHDHLYHVYLRKFINSYYIREYVN